MTPKMRAVYDYIKHRIETDGIAPTYSEIGEHIGDDNRSSIHRTIRALEDRRMIRRFKGRARAIFLVEDINDVAMAVLLKVAQAVSDHKSGAMNAETALREIGRMVGEDAA